VTAMKQTVDEFKEALLNLDRIGASAILDRLQPEISNLDLVSQIVVPALEQIGDGWEHGSLALSEIYMSGRICEQIIDQLLPPNSEFRKHQPRMGIVVLDDFHFLGKRIVHSQIRSAGFELQDYGRKTADQLVAAIQADDLEIVFISTLMYPSALQVKEVRNKIDRMTHPVKIVVGGAPFNLDEQLWQAVGADAMCGNGSEAVKYIHRFMERK